MTSDINYRIPVDSEDSQLSDSSDEEYLPCDTGAIESDYSDIESNDSDSSHPDDGLSGRRNIWKSSLTNVPRVAPDWKGSLPFANKVKNPIYYFKFLLGNILPTIVQQSNLYSIQKDISRPLNLLLDELEQFIGILFYMSIINLPRARLYWTANTRIANVANIMSVKRWEFIKSCFHINDNTKACPFGTEGYDALHKIRPMLTITTNILKDITLGENLCVDEQVVPFKGQSKMKQYNPQKPKKWGFKFFLLCGNDGIVYNYEMYMGKILQAEGMPDIGACGNSVLRMVVAVPLNQNYKLYFDNWFSSINLLVILAQRGIQCVSTVRANRLKNCVLPTDQEIKKKGRGSFVEKKR
ncbi:piggyBac transposable element-derived protein 3-like [Gordionus sp. m RMFG-2023]|uniref:piggyBac transposable element-derived protein 3-like n=1 Tax=Gordionus sp. m RMFG-2023 TaxID=3053472 RepID=UPI0031FC2473